MPQQEENPFTVPSANVTSTPSPDLAIFEQIDEATSPKESAKSESVQSLTVWPSAYGKKFSNAFANFSQPHLELTLPPIRRWWRRRRRRRRRGRRGRRPLHDVPGLRGRVPAAAAPEGGQHRHAQRGRNSIRGKSEGRKGNVPIGYRVTGQSDNLVTVTVFVPKRILSHCKSSDRVTIAHSDIFFSSQHCHCNQ